MKSLLKAKEHIMSNLEETYASGINSDSFVLLTWQIRQANSFTN